MHLFCCVSMVSDRSSSLSLSSSSSSKVINTSSPSHPSRNIAAPRSDSDSNDGFRVGRGDFSRLSLRSGVLPPMELSSKSTPDAQQLPDNGDSLKGNDIVGKFICGILYKWVNIGKGWRRRWLVLQDGVLSYYKIHGPDKFFVNQETEKGSKIIGEESLRQISCRKNVQSLLCRHPAGEIHLKVSTIRQSKSDDKRFSIFSGTKELHLRAATKEDRMAWMEALQAVKDMLLKPSNTELMAPVDNVVVSTERLRQRLLEEGVSEATIQDCEEIVKSEFSSFQNHLLLFKQKENLLIDTLRQLEVYIMIRKKQLASRTKNSSSVSSPTAFQNVPTTQL